MCHFGSSVDPTAFILQPLAQYLPRLRPLEMCHCTASSESQVENICGQGDSNRRQTGTLEEFCDTHHTDTHQPKNVNFMFPENLPPFTRKAAVFLVYMRVGCPP